MSADITVPALGESIVEATVGRWLKSEGDTIEQGEAVVEARDRQGEYGSRRRG